MRDPRFLHVDISYVLQVDIPQVDHVTESEVWDWIRYTWLNYVVWTTSDCETICRKILRVPGLENGIVLVIAMDTSDGYGNLPPVVWDWLKRGRGYRDSIKLWTFPEDEIPGIPPFAVTA